MATKNYARIYELTLPSKKFNFQNLQDAFEAAFKSGAPYVTTSGTIYIKDFKNLSHCIIILIGKDNDDASNYKRNKKKKTFQKLDIDESNEVLADFVHVAISKTKRLQGYTVVAEKNRMFRLGSIYNLFYYVLGGPQNFEIGRRVVKDYIKEINNAKRVVEIKQIDYEPEMPKLPGYHNEGVDTFSIQRIFEIKAVPRGSITNKLLDKIIPTFKQNKDVKTIVTIVNKGGMKVSLDFDEPEAETGLMVELPMNLKTERVQSMIVTKMEDIISKDNEGKL